MTATLNTKLSPLSADAIREYAERVGHHHNIYDSQGKADLQLLVKKIGGEFAEKDNPTWLKITQPRNFSISLPSFISSRRQRLNISQAIGFYFLHYLHPGLTDTVIFKRSELNKEAVVQANIFTSALLMPSEQFIKLYDDYGTSRNWKWILSDIFQVSPKAVFVRAQTLNLC